MIVRQFEDSTHSFGVDLMRLDLQNGAVLKQGVHADDGATEHDGRTT